MILADYKHRADDDDKSARMDRIAHYVSELAAIAIVFGYLLGLFWAAAGAR